MTSWIIAMSAFVITLIICVTAIIIDYDKLLYFGFSFMIIAWAGIMVSLPTALAQCG